MTQSMTSMSVLCSGDDAGDIYKTPRGERVGEVPGSRAAPSTVTIQNNLTRSPRMTEGVSEYTEALNMGPGRK